MTLVFGEGAVGSNWWGTERVTENDLLNEVAKAVTIPCLMGENAIDDLTIRRFNMATQGVFQQLTRERPDEDVSLLDQELLRGHHTGE